MELYLGQIVTIFDFCTNMFSLQTCVSSCSAIIIIIILGQDEGELQGVHNAYITPFSDTRTQ